MAQKNVGFVELEWTCPNCNTRNKGSQKTCTGCGSAQPENVEFHAPADQELVADEKKIEQAEAGPDIHCAYCGARNPGGTAICINCGADLSQGSQRQTGRVIGAFKQTQPQVMNCPACGASNPVANLKCSQCGSPLHPAQTPSPETIPSASNPSRKFPVWIPILGVAGIGIILFLVLLFQQKDASASVTQRLWTRSVEIQQFGPVQHEEWRSNLPASAAVLSCQQEHRSTSNEPVAGAREVCGTPYTVDNGTGYGEVVTDCVYQIYEDYCKYQVDEWSNLKEISVNGQNDAPAWPSPALEQNQRQGDPSEQYQVIFEVNGEQKTFTTSDIEIYNQAEIGSQWDLTLNGLGQITALQRVD